MGFPFIRPPSCSRRRAPTFHGARISINYSACLVRVPDAARAWCECCGRPLGVQVSNSLKRSITGFSNFLKRAAEKQSAVSIGVTLQNGHYEDKSLEAFQHQHTVKFTISAWQQLGLAAGRKARCRGVGITSTRLQRVNRTLHDFALCPGTRRAPTIAAVDRRLSRYRHL